MSKRIFRSDANRVLGGVCAGLGEYLGVDPIFIRIFFVIWTILGEFSVLVYLILWVVIPAISESESGESFKAEELGMRIQRTAMEFGSIIRNPSPQLVTYVGVGLIAWGIYTLLGRLNLPWMNWAYEAYLWPVLLIIAGAVVLIRALSHRP